jgi:Protein of unknown function (DUF3311)
MPASRLYAARPGRVQNEQKKGDAMAYHANANRTNRAAKRWWWLLVLPWIAMIWVPSYNRIDPQLWGFPFFYWYQLVWVLVSAVITGVVYFKTKDVARPERGDVQ